MRTRPLIGTKLWFKPRRLSGWGWMPASWEGWVVVAVSLVITLVIVSATRGATTVLCVIATSIALIVLSAFKGTSPGGPRKRKEFDRLTGR